MSMPHEAFIGQAKRVLIKLPGVQGLNSIRHKIIRIRELSNLINENRIITFPSDLGEGANVTLTRTMVHDVLKEWLDLYGIAYIKRKTVAAIGSKVGSRLLYAPQALLRIPSSHEEYIKQVRRETRRDIRVADRQGYEFKEFDWNDHLDEIYEINTSKEIRQAESMRGWYREPVKPRHHTNEELQYQKYYGGFKDGKLYAYFHFWICGDFAIGKHIIGHSQHLKNGIMNGLISWTVRECTRNPQILWLYYGVWSKGSLNSFKQHAGFQGYVILLDLESYQELLNYSKHKVSTIWRF